MKGTAHENLKYEISAAQLISVADANGRGIDCLQYSEALAVLSVSALGGTDPTLAMKWQHSADDGASDAYADITGAVHPTVLKDTNKLVVSVDLTNIVFTIAAQPAAPATVVAVVTDTTSGITVGTLYVVGTDRDDAVINEILTVAAWSSPTTLKGIKVFKTITSITAGLVTGVTGLADFATLGGSSDETIVVGVDSSGPEVAHVGRFDLQQMKRWLRAVPVRGGSTPTGGYSAGLILGMADRVPVPNVGVGFNIKT